MSALERALLGRRAISIVLVLGCASVTVLAWLGYVAVRQWQESTALLAERQAQDAGNVLLDALTRDMQGVQRSTLLSSDIESGVMDLAGRVELAAGAFAGYAYPESFFFWDFRGASAALFLHRRDRLPSWSEPVPAVNRFPVVVMRHDALGARLLDRVRVDARRGRPFSAFDLVIDGTPYQVVARLTYADRLRSELASVYGFTVNLPWVRRSYVASVAQHSIWTDAPRAGVVLTVLDEEGGVIGVSGRAGSSPATSSRTFPLFFFNPLLVATGAPADLRQVAWTIQAGAAEGSPAQVTAAAASRVIALQMVASAALFLGLWLAVRAGRSSLRLSQLRTDFVSSVSHEFKTPIATIAGAGELLASGRINELGRQREYAGFIVQEARRLSRLVDNLLAFARITDDTVVDRHLEWVAPSELIATALQRFAVHVADGKFHVHIDAPATLPPVLGDVSALRLMLENLIDNAIRHARTERAFTVRALVGEGQFVLEVEDRGGGIPDDEIHLVTRKFFRGRAAGQGGTGLGLAIATRIAHEHGGTLAVSSRVGVGTTVRATMALAAEQPPAGVSSPRARAEDEEHPSELADSGRRG